MDTYQSIYIPSDINYDFKIITNESCEMVTFKMSNDAKITIPKKILTDQLDVMVNGEFKESDQKLVDISNIPFNTYLPNIISYFFDLELFCKKIKHDPIGSVIRQYLLVRYLCIDKEVITKIIYDKISNSNENDILFGISKENVELLYKYLAYSGTSLKDKYIFIHLIEWYLSDIKKRNEIFLNIVVIYVDKFDIIKKLIKEKDKITFNFSDIPPITRLLIKPFLIDDIKLDANDIFSIKIDQSLYNFVDDII